MTFSGSNAGVWDGLSKGDPGHWGLEGMNGPSFLGLNQVSGWNETVTFARPVNFVSLDFSHAIGAGSSVTMELEAFHNGFVIGLTSAILGTANSWTTLSLSSSQLLGNLSIDSISWLGTGFLPDFGVDNFLSKPSPIPELGTWSLLLIGFAVSRFHPLSGVFSSENQLNGSPIPLIAAAEIAGHIRASARSCAA